MRGQGVTLGIILVVVLCQFPINAEAGRGSSTLSWQNDLEIDLMYENNDAWITDTISEIYFTLTLMDAGSVVDFQELVFRITLVTETNMTDEIHIDDPWTIVGDTVRIVAQFNIAPEQVNHAEWDLYIAEFYYDFSIFVELDDGRNMELYTHVYEGSPISISTLSFWILWPFPPIILMCVVYWGLFFGVRKFNARYAGLEKTSKTTFPDVALRDSDNRE